MQVKVIIETTPDGVHVLDVVDASITSSSIIQQYDDAMGDDGEGSIEIETHTVNTVFNT